MLLLVVGRGKAAQQLGVAPQERHDHDGEQREHDRLDDHQRGQRADAHRHPASCRHVCWSTAEEQSQSRQSIRHGITHVIKRHWIGVTYGMSVLHCP